MTTIDLSFRALFAHANGRPYAITGQFDGIDLVNGGKHEATDVGNFGMDDPILSPIDGRGRGLYHFDTAIGVEYELGDGWSLELWHLNATLSAGLTMVPGRSDVGDWIPVKRGMVCGRTGNSGALVNGRPMPAHTHITLERGGQPYDVEPYLLGRPFVTAPEDDMRLPLNLSAIAYGELGAGNRIRETPSLTAPYVETSAAQRVQVFGVVPGQPWAVGGKSGEAWYFIGLGVETGYVATALLPRIQPTTLGERLLPAADCSAQETELQRLASKITRARTANAGARQAQAAVDAALS